VNEFDTKYVPIDRNYWATASGSTSRRQKFTKSDYERAMMHINLALQEHPVVLEGMRHCNELYPIEAASILQLSRTKWWPGFDVDAVLEACMTEWLQRKVQGAHEDDYIATFSKLLLNALEELKCLEGVYLRLNHDVVAQPDLSSVRIVTPVGTVTHRTEPRRNVLMGAVRERVRTLLQSQNAYANQLDVIYNGLQRIHQTYNLEQSLLSWMGYLIVRSVAANQQPIITENQLLIAQQQPRIEAPNPNSQP